MWILWMLKSFSSLLYLMMSAVLVGGLTYRYRKKLSYYRSEIADRIRARWYEYQREKLESRFTELEKIAHNLLPGGARFSDENKALVELTTDLRERLQLFLARKQETRLRGKLPRDERALPFRGTMKDMEAQNREAVEKIFEQIYEVLQGAASSVSRTNAREILDSLATLNKKKTELLEDLNKIGLEALQEGEQAKVLDFARNRKVASPKEKPDLLAAGSGIDTNAKETPSKTKRGSPGK